MRKNIHIENSYCIWKRDMMRLIIENISYSTYYVDAETILNRSYRSMYIEWWFHNIGYYITKPLCVFSCFNVLNNRFRDVDLEEWCDENDYV